MPMDKMTKQELWILTAVSLAPIPLLTVVALLVAFNFHVGAGMRVVASPSGRNLCVSRSSRNLYGPCFRDGCSRNHPTIRVIATGAEVAKENNGLADNRDDQCDNHGNICAAHLLALTFA